MRGLLPIAFIINLNLGITPACAGTTCRSKVKCKAHWGSPLHVRGLQRKAAGASGARGITPACAGTTLQLKLVVILPQDHPCICGDYFKLVITTSERAGSPLHMRGLRISKECLLASVGIIPACAGTT